jgi:hypothetical protein
VKDRTWFVLRDAGMVIEEAEDGDGDEEKEKVLDEKSALVRQDSLTSPQSEKGHDPGEKERNGVRWDPDPPGSADIR